MKRIPRVTPGEILQTEFMQNMTIAELAESTKLSEAAIKGILSGTLPIQNFEAEKLSKVFGTTKQFWLNLQRQERQDDRKK